MFKRMLLTILLIMSFTILVGCNEEEPQPEEEVITTQGLDEAHIYLGDDFDFMENVIFTSNTRGDITNSVEILDAISTDDLGVSIIRYHTHYENDEEFNVERRIVVLYRPDEINMIINGDFSNTTNNWGFHFHNDYPANVQFIIDPDLKRMQVIINNPANDIYWPQLTSSPLNLSSENSYEFSILVSGTVDTFFTIDFAVVDQFNQIIDVVMVPYTVDVGVETTCMQLVTFTFTPLVSCTNGSLRLLFGGNGTESPQGMIFIDNVHLEVID